jgi:predicted N-acetyltransferase YhbS
VEKMEVFIRQEKPTDYQAVFNIIEKAFKDAPIGDGNEQFLVERLRKSSAFIPELSLVAELKGEMIGHILLTRIQIREKDKTHELLALAPVSVLPKCQNQGIGGLLIKGAHAIAIKLGFKLIVLLGHQNYYPRFGYERASNYGIRIPFEAPDENCMVIELVQGGLIGVSGMVEYAPEFFAQ